MVCNLRLVDLQKKDKCRLESCTEESDVTIMVKKCASTVACLFECMVCLFYTGSTEISV